MTAKHLYYRGKDRREYLDIETLEAANKTWAKAAMPLKIESSATLQIKELTGKNERQEKLTKFLRDPIITHAWGRGARKT